MQTQQPSPSKKPVDFLKYAVGRPVIVKLNSGVEYRGVLACLDGYMNIALEQTQEFIEGKPSTSYGDTFIRGNNGKSDKMIHNSSFSHSFSSFVCQCITLVQ